MTAQERAVKVAFLLLVEQLGGLDAAATVAGKKRSALQEYGSLHHPDRFPPADVVMRLEALAGEPLVTAALARAAGFGLAMDGAAGDGCEIAALGQMVRAAGELSGEAFEAAADARVDDAEGARIMRTIDKMRRAMGLFAALMGRRKAGRQ